MELWLIFHTYLYIIHMFIYTLCICTCFFLFFPFLLYKQLSVIWSTLHFQTFSPTLFLFHFAKSAHISGESRNQTVLLWHANSICILQIPLSFCFVWSNKENSHTTSHKMSSLYPLKAVSAKQLPRKAGPAYWYIYTQCRKDDCTQRCHLFESGQPVWKQADNADVLSWTVLTSKTMPLLPMDSLTLLAFIGFPDKRSYIYSLLLCVLQKVSEHVLIRKRVVRVMLQYGSGWLYK